MNAPIRPEFAHARLPDDLPILAIDLPVFYEDEGQEEMGETEWHALVISIVAYALNEHRRQTPHGDQQRVFTDMCLFYHPLDRAAYVSPDVMLCVPAEEPQGLGLRSYRIGTQGPAPLFVVEVLSRRSNQQQDLTEKPALYGRLGVREYLLLDPTGEFMPERMRLIQYDGSDRWQTLRDQGSGVWSSFGFRVALEPGGLPRFYNARGVPFRHPDEAEPVIESLQDQLEDAEERADEEARRANQEELRADEEEQRADREEQRANALQRQIDELRRLLPPDAGA